MATGSLRFSEMSLGVTLGPLNKSGEGPGQAPSPLPEGRKPLGLGRLFCHPSHRNNSFVSCHFLLKIKRNIVMKKKKKKKSHIHGGTKGTSSLSFHHVGKGIEAV